VRIRGVGKFSINSQEMALIVTRKFVIFFLLTDVWFLTSLFTAVIPYDPIVFSAIMSLSCRIRFHIISLASSYSSFSFKWPPSRAISSSIVKPSVLFFQRNFLSLQTLVFSSSSNSWSCNLFAARASSSRKWHLKYNWVRKNNLSEKIY